jgi:hypothetical protein
MIRTLLAEPTEPDRPSSARPTIRISRPPRLDPPYDDERRSAQPTPTAAGIRRQAIAGAAATAPIERDVVGSGAGRAAMAYVRLCVEVLNGYRSPTHLRRIGGPVEFTDVIDQIRRRHNAIGHFATPGRTGFSESTPGRTAVRESAPGHTGLKESTPGRTNGESISGRTLGESPTDRPVNERATVLTSLRNQTPPAARRPGNDAVAFSLTRLRVSEPRDGIAEVVAVLSRGGTSLAVALRLERRVDAWTCTLVQVV